MLKKIKGTSVYDKNFQQNGYRENVPKHKTYITSAQPTSKPKVKS